MAYRYHERLHQNSDGTWETIREPIYYESEEEKRERLLRSSLENNPQIQSIDGNINPNYQPYVPPTDVNREEQLYGQGLLDTPVATGETTQYGKDVYTDTSGQQYSEKSQTINIDGKWVNVPTVFDNGVIIDDEQVLKSAVVNGVLQPTSVHNTLDEALVSAQTRSDGIEPTRKYVPPLPEDNSGTITRDPTFQGVEAPEGGILNNMAKVKEERLGALLGQNLVGLLSPKTQGNVYSEQGIPSFDSGFSRPYEGQDYVPMSTERQGIPSYSNPTVDSNYNPLQQPYPVMHGGGDNPFQQPFQPVEATSQRDSILDMVEQRPEYGDSTNPLNLLNVEDERLMDMVDSGILPSSDYMNLRENAERWKAQDAGVLANRAELTTDDFGQVLPQADIYGNKLTPDARVDLYQDQTDATNTLLNSREFSLDDDISEPDVVGGILDQHADSNEADNSYSINLNEVPSLIKDKISNWYNNTNFAKSFKGWKSSAELLKQSKEINRGKTGFWHENNVNNQQLDAIWSGIKDAYKGTIAPFVTKDSFINALHNPDHPRHQEAVDLPKNLTRGTAQGLLYELPQGTLELGADVVNFVANKFGLEDVLTEDDISFIPEIYPKDKYPELWESGAFNFAKVSAQLMSGYGAIKTALKKSLFKKDGIKGKMATEVLSTGGAGLTLDPTDGNLSTMLNNTDFRNAITEYLASDTDSKVAEDRLKARLQNFVEEGLFGTVASGFLFAQHLKNTPDALDGWGEVMDKVYDVSTMGAGKKEMFAGDKGLLNIGDDINPNATTSNKSLEEGNYPFSYNERLDMAKDFERGGTSAQSIWKSTGFKRAKDGKWRFEIDDSTAIIKTDWKKDLLRHPDTAVYLGDILDHPTLFKAYPELEHLPVFPFNYVNEKSIFGGFSDKDFSILMKDQGFDSVNKWAKNSAGKWEKVANPDLAGLPSSQLHLMYKERLLHEVQHAVQFIEDFAPGGNTANEARRLFEAHPFVKELREDLTKIEGERDKLTDAYKKKYGKSWVEGGFDSVQQEKDWDAIVKKSHDVITVQKRNKRGMENIDDILKNKAKENYNNLHGEREAYQTQYRTFLTPSARRHLFPDMTESDASIVRDRDGNDIASGLLDEINTGKTKEMRDIHPQYAGDRVNELERLKDVTTQTSNNILIDIPEKSITDFEGKPFVTTQSDRSEAGKILTHINDVELKDAVPLRGGQNYMRNAENYLQGNVWASAQGGTSSILNMANKLKNQTGDNPFIMPYKMKPTGIDFTHQTTEAMINYADTVLTRADKTKLNKLIKKVLPTWKGIGSPNLQGILNKTTGEQRKAIQNILDVNFRDAGISLPEARVAVSDVTQLNAPDATLQNVGLLDLTRTNKSNHPSYNQALKGDPVGRIKEDISAWDILTSEALGRNVDPKTATATDYRSLTMKPKGGILDDELLRSLDDKGLLNNNAKLAIPAGGLLSEESENLNQQVKTQALSQKVAGYVNVKTNNPGNIMMSGSHIDWDGLKDGTDVYYDVNGEKYYQFKTPEYGVRALTRDLKTKRNKKTPLNTIEKIIPIYAPQGHGNNNPPNYIKIVSQRSGIPKDKVLEDSDMFELIKAITHMEGSGSLQYYTDAIIKKGMEMEKAKKKKP